MDKLQEAWLAMHNPKVLKEVYVVETPILNQLFLNRKDKCCDSGRTIYQRKYIEQVRGKCCSMCNTTLSGDNTWVVNKIFPRKYYEEVYCVRCAALSSIDKHEIRKLGYNTFIEVKAIKLRIEKLQDKIRHWKQEFYFYRPDEDTIKRNIKELRILIDNLKKQIKVLTKGATPVEVKYEVDYSEIVPFRSEDDFDF